MDKSRMRSTSSATNEMPSPAYWDGHPLYCRRCRREFGECVKHIRGKRGARVAYRYMRELGQTRGGMDEIESFPFITSSCLAVSLSQTHNESYLVITRYSRSPSNSRHKLRLLRPPSTSPVQVSCCTHSPWAALIQNSGFRLVASQAVTQVRPTSRWCSGPAYWKHLQR